MITEKFFCKKCKYSGNEVSNENGCDALFKTHGWDNVGCLEYNSDKFGEIADEINGVWKQVMPELSNDNKLKSGHFSDVNGKLMVMGEKEDMIEDTKFEIKKKKVGSEFDWFFEENGTEKSYTKDYLKYSDKKLDENIMIKENMDRLPQMIDDKLREFNFYTVDSKKGKQKISFTDDDREVMKNNFIDMSEKYPEDIAFIRSVVSCKDIDEKTNEPFVKLGSYRDSSNINLPFSKKVNGLEKVLDGGINYFTIENNPGPDNRDFKILPGDLIKDIEFSEESKEDMSEPMGQPSPQVEKEEPFEEVMKGKEKKGLASLVQTDEVGNDFTKKQKEILEKLKKQGYLFKQPVNQEGYDMKKVKSKEFTESFKVWKKKS